MIAGWQRGTSARTLLLMHLAMSVLPVPGGPKSSRPLGMARKPLNRSLRRINATGTA